MINPRSLVTQLHMPVIARIGDVIFLRLPVELQETVPGGCSCPYCRSHPDRIPKWDTLALPSTPAADRHQDSSWRVHMPEEHRNPSGVVSWKDIPTRKQS